MDQTGFSTKLFSALPGCKILGEFLTEFGIRRVVDVFDFFGEVGDVFYR